MTDVADVSPGTVLRATTSGFRYRVQGESDDRVVLCGPRGSLGVNRDALQRDIARGKIEVDS